MTIQIYRYIGQYVKPINPIKPNIFTSINLIMFGWCLDITISCCRV